MRLSTLVLASSSLVVAQNATRTSSSGSSSTQLPCAVASSLLADPSNGNIIPAKVAYDCLTSVPVDVEGDAVLIDELKLLWEWHSETGWLKNPPPHWDLGPLDLIAELDKIKAKLPQYRSEYDVQRDIEALTIRTGDFHMNWSPDILN